MRKDSARSATIREFAVKAGVSRTAVPLALRNDPSIPPKTRDHIIAVADSMDYRPNPLVKALMAQLGGRRSEAERPIIALFDYYSGKGA